MKIHTLPGESSETYALLAPFAMSRAVVRELGGPIYTSATHRWIVARSEQGALLGWAGVDFAREGRAALDWSYVLPDQRQRGVFVALTEARFEIGVGRILTASTCRPYLQSWYIRRGFVETRRNGAWTSYQRAP